MSAETPKADGDQQPPPEKRNPHDLIHEEDVLVVLKNDKGTNVDLISFKVVDFTTKGDNYACVVSSVQVWYSDDGVEKETSYIAKLNPCRLDTLEIMSEILFYKEIGFYSTLLPMLNAELERVNERHLKVAKYFHSVQTKQNEIIFLQDLRVDGFKMFDRKKGLDKQHTELIITELARLHAASSLLMSRGEFRGVDMIEKMPILKESFLEMGKENDSLNMKTFFPSIIENASKIAGIAKGYEKAQAFLMAKKDEAFEIMMEQLKVTDQFEVICHGDCWNNNFLFSYSPDGQVEDCRLVDLQVTRVGSPALDINYMLFCSLNGDVRRSELNNFLIKYYATFASVVAASGMPMKFTLDELKKEFKNKNYFGLLMGMMLIPIVLMNSEDAPNFDEFTAGNPEAQMEEFQELIMKQVQKNPLLKPRFLDLFDDMEESGIIC